MVTKRKVEVFMAGCPICDETVKLVKRTACESCEVTVLDTNDAQVAKRAESLGVSTIPAVAVNGQLSACCSGMGPEERALRNAGVGQRV